MTQQTIEDEDNIKSIKNYLTSLSTDLDILIHGNVKNVLKEADIHYMKQHICTT